MEKFEIFYIRHADTSSAVEGNYPCDVGLSDLGERQIALLADRFAGAEFDAVLSSPLIRAVKTAAAVAKKLAVRPVIEIVPELIEKGTMPGYGGAELSLLSRYYDSLTLCPDRIYGDENGAFSNMTDEENAARARAVITYLKNRFGYGKKIAVFAHGSFGNSFLPAALGIDEGDYILSINHTSVTKIKYTADGDVRMSFQNDFSHLRPLMPDYEFSV